MSQPRPASDDWRSLPAMITMLASHDAFRRDLTDFQKFTNAGRSVSEDVLRSWNDFILLLDNHHRSEDEFLWPLARKAIAGDTSRTETLDRMQEQHHALEPLLQAVDGAWNGPATTAAQPLQQLLDNLEEHLQDEETLVLPWIAHALSDSDWQIYQEQSRDTTNNELPAIFLPWIAYTRNDGPDEGVNAVIPAPLASLVRTDMLPNYEKRQQWRQP
jgi:hemerythrin-like domain-containing protein